MEQHPTTYDNAKSIEAHMIDAHGLHMSTRESLADLLALHLDLHSSTPPRTAQGGPMWMRPHVHGIEPYLDLEAAGLTEAIRRELYFLEDENAITVRDRAEVAGRLARTVTQVASR